MTLRPARHLAIVALAAAFGSAAAPAAAGHRIEAPGPYVAKCAIAAAHLELISVSEVLPGPAYPAPRGYLIAVLAGGTPYLCHITNGFQVLSVRYDMAG